MTGGLSDIHHKPSIVVVSSVVVVGISDVVVGSSLVVEAVSTTVFEMKKYLICLEKYKHKLNILDQF